MGASTNLISGNVARTPINTYGKGNILNAKTPTEISSTFQNFLNDAINRKESKRQRRNLVGVPVEPAAKDTLNNEFNSWKSSKQKEKGSAPSMRTADFKLSPYLGIDARDAADYETFLREKGLNDKIINPR